MTRSIKRLIDIGAALTGLVLFSPVLLCLAGLIRVTMGSPILFRQTRPGLHGKPFVVLKFRTMRVASGPDGKPLSDAERMTRLGSFLRRSSLDELPQLWHVLKGELSLVGPRPLLVEYLSLYTPEQARRHNVRPGITGWAQVNGRNAIAWEEKFALDTWYVDHWSLRLDFKILIMTLSKVIRGEGINADAEVTAYRFRGSDTEERVKASSPHPLPPLPGEGEGNAFFSTAPLAPAGERGRG